MVAVVDERGTQARPHGAGMSGAVECHYYGRDFTTQEMGLLCSLIGGPPALNGHALSKEFCRRIRWLNIRWLKPDGLIALPPPKWRQNRPGPIVFGPEIEPPLIPAPATLDEVHPLDLRLVVRDTREGKRWNEFVARYHYLGYKTLVGTQMRYAVHDRSPCSALHRRVEARATRPLHRLDAATAREESPPRGRQPEFPHPALDRDPQPGLAHPRHRPPAPARGLSRALQQNPRAIETFVQTLRYTGAVYRASGWIHVGTTQGRGRYDRYTRRAQPKKDIWLRPLRKNWKRTLNR